MGKCVRVNNEIDRSCGLRDLEVRACRSSNTHVQITYMPSLSSWELGVGVGESLAVLRAGEAASYLLLLALLLLAAALCCSLLAPRSRRRLSDERPPPKKGSVLPPSKSGAALHCTPSTPTGRSRSRRWCCGGTVGRRAGRGLNWVMVFERTPTNLYSRRSITIIISPR